MKKTKFTDSRQCESQKNSYFSRTLVLHKGETDMHAKPFRPWLMRSVLEHKIDPLML